VNKTSAPTDSGSVAAGGIYTAGRTKPDIVVPENNASRATPRVASAAALLIDAAHSNPAWSTDPAGISATNRNGDVIYNAERVEVIRAALMAGASRQTNNSSSTDIVDYRVDAADRTANGLDRRFGAGQLNISNSYHIVAAGEQNSVEDFRGGGGLIGAAGFDFDPAFGGYKGSNSTATYFLTPTAGPARLIASLVWNVTVDGGTANNFDGSASLYDLDMMLYDVTNAANWAVVASSTSPNENTENLWELVEGGRAYAMHIKRGVAQNAFKWDYGLAWQLKQIPPLAVSPIVLPDAYANEAYPPQALTAVGGESPNSWSIVAGALPIGLTFSQDGVISGVPIEITAANFTVQVTDAVSQVAVLGLQINVQQGDCACNSGCHATAGF
jgi:hypothetical protein